MNYIGFIWGLIGSCIAVIHRSCIAVTEGQKNTDATVQGLGFGGSVSNNGESTRETLRFLCGFRALRAARVWAFYDLSGFSEAL